ncbi:MAG: hypothetical protein LUQ50_13190 [Methanospirillum sp.]|uniref:hypothetical protein n=1 Tax=Methanospirillum sp. TaxID=45200 RepID=UPI00236DEF00|nr:hypothetical protein [Methanospirillum sp.]MDD1730011.1 hypothetical protein [Methanospirillum sp.]
MATAAVNTGWQPVNITSWAQIDVPPGWSYGEITRDPVNPETSTLEAISPDRATKLVYVFEHNSNPISAGELCRTQNRFMDDKGFCLCQANPLFTETAESTVAKQTYIKGEEDGAVVCSGAYPGWGRYQYALLMNGASSVSKYYDDLPDDIAEHIRPIAQTNTTGSA